MPNRIEVTRSGARTHVTALSATSPLALLTPKNHGHGAWVYQSSHGGGWVGLDEVALEVTVGDGATLFLSTQAGGKAYRGATSTFRLRARVGRGATLVCWPEPTTCFAGAALMQHQRFELDEGARLLFVDTLAAGRVARGEQWAFSKFESEVAIAREGRALLHDAVLLSAAHGPLAPRLGCEASALVVAVGFEKRLTDAPGVSVWPWGAVLRRAAPTLSGWQTELRALLQTGVAEVLGDDPCARRF